MSIDVQLIKDLGFPIAGCIGLFAVLTQSIRWWFKRYEEQYKDHRDDVMNLTSNFSTSLSKAVDAFEASVGATQERQTIIITHLNDLGKKNDLVLKNTDIILSRVTKSK